MNSNHPRKSKSPAQPSKLEPSSSNASFSNQELEEDLEPPPISFKITTISNSRIDKVVTSVENEQKIQSVVVEEEPKRGFLMASTRPLKFVGISTAADESEFSYDYETYMFHVTSAGRPKVIPVIEDLTENCCPRT